jgi:hypothetical protein
MNVRLFRLDLNLSFLVLLVISIQSKSLRSNCIVSFYQIVDQESLQAVEEISSPVVFCDAAWLGKVRLIDNVKISQSMKDFCFSSHCA